MKLRRPRSRDRAVARPRLVARLNDGPTCALTLISAPAGFGKTTLLGEWLDQLPPTVATAWLSLDPDDDDPARFVSYVVAALDRALPGVGAAALDLLAGSDPAPIRAVLTSLLNGLVMSATDVVLVLDDYHLIGSVAVHDAVEFFLANLPPSVRVVIATRFDPPLPLSRLRARDQLSELRGADLLFRADEAAAFLNGVMALGLDAADVAALEATTEGWVAGLQLAGLSLRGRPDVARLVETLGTHRHVVDYLVDEVLSQQPEPRRRFLTRTSILGQLVGPLCDAVTGDDDGAAMLVALEHANLLITPLDAERRWHRYHHLFAECLRGRLLAESPETVADLHRRASRWYESQDSLDEAIGHALAAPDFPLAARLVEARAPRLLADGRMTSVLGQIGRLPDEIVGARPRLLISRAQALSAAGQLDAAEIDLGRAEAVAASWPAAEAEGLRGVIASVRASIATLRGDVPRTIEHARSALSHLPVTETLERSRAAFSLGVACMFAGDMATAGEALASAIQLSVAAGSPHRAAAGSARLAGVEYARGRLEETASVCRRAIDYANSSGRAVPTLGVVHAYLGRVAWERDDLAAAENHVDRALRLAQESGSFDGLCIGNWALSALRLARGDESAALAAVDRAVQAAADVRPVRRYMLSERAAILIALGRLDEASRWARECQPKPSDLMVGPDWPDWIAGREMLGRSRLHLARGEPLAALSLLDRLRPAVEATGRTGEEIEIRVLESLALAAADQRPAALRALGRALALAAPEGFIRTFAERGEPLAALLREVAAPGALGGYVSRLLQAIGAGSAPRPASDVPTGAAAGPPGSSSIGSERLTAREVEVLRLLARGASNQDIADELIVSIGTVKAHVSHILDKLGAQNRTEVVARARRLGLVGPE